jgi:hypothetical protein
VRPQAEAPNHESSAASGPGDYCARRASKMVACDEVGAQGPRPRIFVNRRRVGGVDLGWLYDVLSEAVLPYCGLPICPEFLRLCSVFSRFLEH